MYRAPRGTADILPVEQPYWRFVEQKAAAICQLYGYERIDTPTFEDTQLFARGIGDATDIVRKEMYSFSGGELTLRPEGTAPVCRAYIQHGMHSWPQPVKLYYIASLFRHERPQAGRYRQHHQFGYEAIGSADAALDGEVIDVAWQFYQSLGLRDLSLQLNSIGCRKCRPEYLAALRAYYEPVTGLCRDCVTRRTTNPLRLLDCKNESCQQVADAAPKSTDQLCPECATHFGKLKGHLAVLGIPFEVNHRLVRGLDYYTRTVFEFQPAEGGAQSAIGGGGRYDDLIEVLGGRPTPGIGFATGIERIVLNLKKQGIPVPALSHPPVFIAGIGDAARDEAVKLAARLRRSGIGVIEAVGGRSLKAQLRQANSLGARYTVIIGEEELAGDNAVLRDMSGARQETVPLGQLPQKLQKMVS
ncbi:MAG TPA: histidine--tRNA ligase [Dehalococcoidia bacterium]|nr:histidine--tRNA ligase [Dehalococcoidia bacterium]